MIGWKWENHKLFWNKKNKFNWMSEGFEHTYYILSNSMHIIDVCKIFGFDNMEQKNEFKDALFCYTPLSNNICWDEFTLNGCYFSSMNTCIFFYYLLTFPHHLFHKIKYSILLLNSFPNSWVSLVFLEIKTNNHSQVNTMRRYGVCRDKKKTDLTNLGLYN